MSDMVKFDFHGDALEVVKDDAGLWISIRRVCEALGIEEGRQQTKLREKPWATTDMKSLVAADGRNREVFCINLKSFPMWLATISPSKVADAVCAKLERFQREAADVLAAHFLPAGALSGLPRDVRMETADITPEKAREWLEHRNELNRSLSGFVVKKYASDMTAGKWALTHQGLAFGPGGELIDGQHRLKAIVDSGVTVRMVVYHFGTAALAREAKLKTDIGCTKRYGHVLELAGLVERGGGKDVAAIVAAIALLNGQQALSIEEVCAFYLANQGPIDWARSTLAKVEFNAPVRAAFAYAFPVAPDAIRAFAPMIVDKIGYKPGSAAHLYVKAQVSKHFAGLGGGARLDVMRKVLRLLKGHVTGEKNMRRLQTCAEGLDYFRKARTAMGLDGAQLPAASAA